MAGHSKTFKWLAFILAELIVVIGVFALGLNVGLRKAKFTYSWINNYPSNFLGAGRNPVIPPPPDNQNFLNAHGVLGTVLSASKTGLVIKDQDGEEKTIVLMPNTTIRENYQTESAGDLKTNQQIIIIGSPTDDGQIQANFIRILN